MKLYAQHGYGKSTKITSGLQSRSLDGVIFGPRDELPENLIACVADVRTQFPQADVLIDPQFYASTIMPVRDGNLPRYESYYTSGLSRRHFLSGREIANDVRKTLDFQADHDVTRWLSPTVSFEDFNDPWSQIALSLAQESCEYHASVEGAPPLLLSFVIGESAYRHFDPLSEFLDLVSSFEPHGFYIIVRRQDGQYSPAIDTTVLENMMYQAHVLGAINEYEVVYGYTDLIGLPLQAVGATATACGWHNSLRQFTMARFMPATGGRTPRVRYTSLPLLNSILHVPELAAINAAGQLASVVSGSPHDATLLADFRQAPWTQEISTLHHWGTLKKALRLLSREHSVQTRLDSLMRMMNGSEGLYAQLETRGIAFEPSSDGHHLPDWRTSITDFKAKTGI